MKKLRRKVKGMTLLEVMVALAIFAMLGLVVVQVSVFINKTMIDTEHMNHKVSAQSPIAEQQYIPAPSDPDALAEESPTKVRVFVRSGSTGATYDFEATEYSTEKAMDAYGWNADTSSRGNLHYTIVDVVTDVTTVATGTTTTTTTTTT